MRIEVIYALPGIARRRTVRLRRGATVRDAVRESGLLGECPEIDLARNRVGIFGAVVALETPLRDGERVEIYRPLPADPKELRRRRAAADK